MTMKELLEARATIINEARKSWDDATRDGKEPTAEQVAAYDKALDEAEKLSAEYDKLDAENTRKTRMAALEARLKDAPGRKTDAGRPVADTCEPRSVTIGEGANRRTIPLTGELATPEYNLAWRNYLATAQRSLQVDKDEYGGFVVAPTQFMAELIQAVDNEVVMRRIARVLPPIASAHGIGVPSLDTDPADPTWVSELSTGAEDTAMKFGKRELHPHACANRILISKTLLRAAVMDVESIVRQRLAYKMGVVLENGYLNGSGAPPEPLGLFTASDNGIPTTRDVSTDNTSSTVTFDGLTEAFYSLKPQYQARASWLFNRGAVKRLAKLKDGEGQRIWQPSIVLGTPDMLMGRPVIQSEYVPNTWSSGKYVGIVGDFQFYWIVDALSMTIQVVDQLYAATNQNAYFARFESDGMPVLAEAFARVKLG